MKRNSVVLSVVLFILAVFAWAAWANFAYRKQAREQFVASAAQNEMATDSSNGALQLVTPLQGKPAPPFSLEDLTGKKLSLADYKGKAVLINFWATWCAPCKIETPWLIELRNQYAAQGFEVLAISADDLDRGDSTSSPTRRRRSPASCKNSRCHIRCCSMPTRSASLTADWTSCPPPFSSIATESS